MQAHGTNPSSASLPRAREVSFSRLLLVASSPSTSLRYATFTLCADPLRFGRKQYLDGAKKTTGGLLEAWKPVDAAGILENLLK